MKVLVTDPIHENGLGRLKEFSDVEVSTDLSHEELVEKVPEFDVMIVRSATKVKKDVLDAGDNLKLIVRAGVGLDNIDLEYADKSGIEVENTPEASTVSVAELTLGLMLSWARKIPQADKSTKKGEWKKSQLAGTELKGKILGIIGTGRIGIEVARRAKAFGMEPAAYDVIKRDEFRNLEGRYLEMETLLKKSDYITIHVPLRSSTKHMISEDEFDLMKNSSVLVNTARGGVVDEEALIDALKEEKIAGACLDVYEGDPLENKRLLDLQNVVLTPHLGAASEEAQKRVGILAASRVKEKLE